MDSLNNMLSIVIAVVIMFIFPLLYFAQKQDVITQIYISNETSYFVDNLKNKGFLSREMYQDYIEKLSNTKNIYKIELTHSKKMVNPEIDESTGAFLENYYISYIDYYEDEIMEVLDKGDRYLFSQGDYINIKVKNISPTLSVKIMRALYRSNISTEQILISYGGAVRDETW